jgi:TPR repeat protein
VRSAIVAPPIVENDFAAVENDLAAAIGKPIVAAPSIPTPEVAPKSESALAPDAPNPVSGSVSPSGTLNPKSESARASAASNPVSGPASAPRTELATASVSGATPASEDAVKLANDEIAMLLRLGKNFLINGDVASARLLLRRAAAAGNAEAAFVLGTTFDPLVAGRMGIIGGMEPDVGRARQWYERAAELGSTAVMMLALRYSNCASLLDFCPRP